MEKAHTALLLIFMLCAVLFPFIKSKSAKALHHNGFGITGVAARGTQTHFSLQVPKARNPVKVSVHAIPCNAMLQVVSERIGKLNEASKETLLPNPLQEIRNVREAHFSRTQFRRVSEAKQFALGANEISCNVPNY